jgi:hypothetical protein
MYEVCVTTFKYKSQVKRWEKPGLRLVKFLKQADQWNHNVAIFKTKDKKLAKRVLKKMDFNPNYGFDPDEDWDEYVVEY